MVTEGICGRILRDLREQAACHSQHHTSDSATKRAYLLISMFNTGLDCVCVCLCVASLSCCCEIGATGAVG